MTSTPASRTTQFTDIPLTYEHVLALRLALEYLTSIGQRAFGQSAYDEDAGVYIRQGDSDLTTMATSLAMVGFAEFWGRVLRTSLSDRMKPVQDLDEVYAAVVTYDIPARLVRQEEGYVLIARREFVNQINGILSLGWDFLVEGLKSEQAQAEFASCWDTDRKLDEHYSFDRAVAAYKISLGEIARHV